MVCIVGMIGVQIKGPYQGLTGKPLDIGNVGLGGSPVEGAPIYPTHEASANNNWPRTPQPCKKEA